MEVAAPPTAFSITPTTSYSRTTGRCWDFTQRWRDSRSRGCVPHAVLGFESLGLKHVALSQDSTPAWPQARASSPVRGATELHGSARFFRFRNTATDRVSPSRCRIVPFASVDGVCEARTLGRQEVPVEVEQKLGARPSAHILDPFEIRTEGQVKTREGMTQSMRAELAVRSQSARHDSSEGTRPEVVRVDISTCPVWEDQRIVSDDIGSDF